MRAFNCQPLPLGISFRICVSVLVPWLAIKFRQVAKNLALPKFQPAATTMAVVNVACSAETYFSCVFVAFYVASLVPLK